MPVSSNDQVLTAIALDFGSNEQLPGIVVPDSLRPVLDVQDYRRKFEFFAETVIPTVTSVNIKFTFRPPKNKRYRVWLGYIDSNQPSAKFDVLTQLITTSVPGFQWQLGNLRFDPGAKRIFIGDLETFASLPEDMQIPRPFDVLNAMELVIILDPDGNWDAAGILIRLLLEVLPKERELSKIAATTQAVP